MHHIKSYFVYNGDIISAMTYQMKFMYCHYAYKNIQVVAGILKSDYRM
jgi:hypothetical protein